MRAEAGGGSTDLPVPRGWRLSTLGEVGSWASGGTPSKATPSFWTGTIPWVSPKDMKSFVLEDVSDHVSEGGVNAGSRLTPAGSIFVVVRGMILAHTFPVCIASRPMAFNQDVKAIVPGEGVDSRFLAHWLVGQSHRMLGLTTESTHGTKRIDLADLQAHPIALPPLLEQRRIAEILDAADEAIKQTDGVIAKLRMQRMGVVADLLASGLDRHGRLRSRGDDGGVIPGNWPIRPLGSVAEVGSGVTLGRSLGDGPSTLALPYLRVANVQDGFIDLTEVKTVRVLRDEVERFRLRVGDVLMNEGGDFDKLGRGAVWQGQIDPCLHQNHVFRVRADREVIEPQFLALMSSSEYGKRYFLLSSKQTTNLASINSTQVKAFPMPCPLLEEQRRVVAMVEAMDARIRCEVSYLNKLKLQKQGLMQDLLAGRVRVKA